MKNRRFKRVSKIEKRGGQLLRVCLSVRSSVRLSAYNISASTGRVFMKFDVRVFFENLPEKIYDSLKSGKNDGYFILRSILLFAHILLFLLRMKSFQTNSQKKIVTHILSSVNCIFFFLLRKPFLFCEIILKNMVQRNRPLMKIRRMPIVRWVTKATNTHSEYVTILALHCNSGCRNASQC